MQTAAYTVSADIGKGIDNIVPAEMWQQQCCLENSSYK